MDKLETMCVSHVKKRWTSRFIHNMGKSIRLVMNRGELYAKSGKNGGWCEEIQKNPGSYPQVINILWISGKD